MGPGAALAQPLRGLLGVALVHGEREAAALLGTEVGDIGAQQYGRDAWGPQEGQATDSGDDRAEGEGEEEHHGGAAAAREHSRAPSTVQRAPASAAARASRAARAARTARCPGRRCRRGLGGGFGGRGSGGAQGYGVGEGPDVDRVGHRVRVGHVAPLPGRGGAACGGGVRVLGGAPSAGSSAWSPGRSRSARLLA
ncbi:hypothetical protein SANTM175S_02967 [Streptomyces antimycoticus]